MEKYDPNKIEAKWQKYWEENKINTPDLDKAKKPFYNLMMFPYPSAEGLHVGNMYAFAHADAYGRFMRLKGFDVFEPIGLDGFGIHSENFAIKQGEHILDVSKRTEKHFYEQLRMIGNQYDWTKHLETYKPEYYKWTQWIFVQMFKKGLAYQTESFVNWCPSCKTVLSDEQVILDKCERCGTLVEKKMMKQWFFRITDYAERLLKNLETINWSERTKIAQRNWIGKSDGAQFKMKVIGDNCLAAKYDKVLLATNNLSKKARVEKLLKAIGIQTKILTPKDLGIEVIESKEEGGLFENAKEKAELYRGKTDLPVLGIDTGFFMQGEIIDPVKVKRNALEGKNEKELSQEEIGKLIHEYYKGIAKKRGGKVDAYWQDVAALSLSDGTIWAVDDKREVTMTDQVKGEIDIYFPLRSLYISKATGKYIADQTEEDELIEQSPFIETLRKLLCEEELFVEVFTTRLDTVFGMTYAVIAPEHEIIEKLKAQITNAKEVEEYIERAKKKSDLERTELAKEKTGVELKGVKLINPFNNEAIPVFVGDYVLGHYGTGAVMAVPAHDERDYEFAKKHNLEIREVIKSTDGKSSVEKEAFTEDGILSNSREYDNATSAEAREKLVRWLKEKNLGGKKINYKLRDWCVSRQRYWGPPIPIIHCEKCGVVPVPENELPVLLPETKDYLPQPDGLSPLARNENFVKVKCPKCGEPARRETDVSDTFLDSAWYFFRYPSTDFNDEPFDKEKTKKWLPVDMYIGGQEHAVLHLLYSRFVTMVFCDMGLIDFDEPYKRFFAHGLLIREGAKMSKSKGNVINPDEYIKKYGADSVRMYLMFLGDVRQGGNWQDAGMNGMHRFASRIWRIKSEIRNPKSETNSKSKIQNLIHKTIKKVTEDLEGLKFNTAISALMVLVNAFEKEEEISSEDFGIFLKLLSPFAPHIAEEMWSQLGSPSTSLRAERMSIFSEKWPEYDPALVKDEMITLIIQINGKVRDKIEVAADISEEAAKATALASANIKKFLAGQEPKKVIFVKNKLINFVT